MPLTNRTLIVFQFLWQTTDEDHPASLADISGYLAKHSIRADPRTLRKDIDQLVEFGVDIVKTAEYRTNIMLRQDILKLRRSGF